MKKVFGKALCFLLVLQNGYAQMASDKSGAITNNGQAVAEVTKYGGNANVRPKFWVVSTTNDSLLHINFKKEFDSDWMQFDFKKASKMIEVNAGEVIHGLNYRKNIAAFLLQNNLLTQEGKICDTAFERFAGNHTENLSEKYHKLNEMNRKIAAASFSYQTQGDVLLVNGKVVGTVSVANGQGLLVNDVVMYDDKKRVVASGSRGMYGDMVMKMIDGKELKLKVSDGNTMSSYERHTFVTSLLRELCRYGYYPL